MAIFTHQLTRLWHNFSDSQCSTNVDVNHADVKLGTSRNNNVVEHNTIELNGGAKLDQISCKVTIHSYITLPLLQILSRNTCTQYKTAIM